MINFLLDILLLAVATEIGTKGTWLDECKIGTKKEDYFLKKLTILCCCFLPKDKNTVKVYIF